MMIKLRRYFVAGLLLILPLFITVYLITFIFKFIDGIFGGFINNYLEQTFGFFIPGIGIVLGITLVLVAGFFASHFLGKKVLHAFEGWFLKLPGIRQIYPSAKQIVGFLFSKDQAAFKKVVLIEYPSKGIWSLGFMTNTGFKEAQDKIGEELIHVLIGTTPGPWSGFLVFVAKRDVKFMDMSIEDGMKLIISGGILKPDAG
ncbi:MAG: hypothetical protein A2Y00_09590 [Omnitrophica WOR_2 bacterium GWF2_43_52]|nr:MAG: hypothetical protein A2062_02005 [Omnitrophica WOR_2 bacterium GWA2_44_7]OGX21486.1 MAG: hypothetical protein A2Y00_09590 [Omnitrophica WOR_2 bacterium GWF2_43_52]HAH21749.1 hypothetical protein [Candidatus Omnitrophota bacterium]HBG63739.1 hypothetical protein [Candidatus Omnitrophota bacterium]HCD38095.1 hypothetical protein [Candidatus Omnitrophota bacterium]